MKERIEEILDSLNIPKVNFGDIIKLGKQTLLCNDSLDESILEFLPKNIKILFTSPPYYNQRSYHGVIDKKKDFSNVVKIFSNVCDLIFVNLGIVFKNGEIFPYWNSYIEKAKESDLKLLHWLVWDKKSSSTIGPMVNFIFPLTHEFIFVFGKQKLEAKRIVKAVEQKKLKKRHYMVSRRDKKTETLVHEIRENKYYEEGKDYYRKVFSCISLSKEMSSDPILNLHPARFPANLPEIYLKSFLNENDFFIDPFCGSGSSLIAGEKNDFKGYGVEINPEYCRMTIYRFMNMFSLKTIKINEKEIELDYSKLYLKENYKSFLNEEEEVIKDLALF